jgi:putative membrane protein
MTGLATIVPYCGSPPNPGGLWTRWNLDPVLLAVLLAVLAVYVLALRREPDRAPAWRSRCFVAGWVVLTLALVSPLCPLSVSLFSARVGQHMILTLIAAPLLVLGRPAQAAYTAWPALRRRAAGLRMTAGASVSGAVVAFTAAIWFWHAPGPYAATFTSDLVYWLMHLTVIGSALWLWSALLDTRPERALAVLAAGAASTLQMTFLGALITLTNHLLYTPHLLTTYAWGLTPIGDQQLGGLIMWVPGCSVFLGVTLFTLARLMAERDAPAALA